MFTQKLTTDQTSHKAYNWPNLSHSLSRYYCWFLGL